MKNKKLGFDTLQVHGGQHPDSQCGARAVPIYQTASYVFRDTEHAKDLFALKEAGDIYTRITNPTTAVLEERIALLEGGSGALALASGSAAVTYAVMNIAGQGDGIVAAGTLYGGTYNLFANTLPRYGIQTVFADTDEPESFRRAITPRTKGIFIESIGNPGSNIPDIEKIAGIAHDNNIPLIVDNTSATPYLLKPFDYGADIVVHSTTKFIGGHGTSIGGIIVDSGRFSWENNDKFPGFNTPDPSYHGMVYARDLKETAYIIKARVQLLRDMGACISPFNAFLLLQGLETLSLRVRRHVSNARRIAAFLQSHPKVLQVDYPELPGSPYKPLADKYFPKGTGSIFTFRIKGGEKQALEFIGNLEIFSHLANVADAKSLVIHPASTTHSQLTPLQKEECRITTDQIRLSVGIEDISDLIRDLEDALEKTTQG